MKITLYPGFFIILIILFILCACGPDPHANEHWICDKHKTTYEMDVATYLLLKIPTYHYVTYCTEGHYEPNN